MHASLQHTVAFLPKAWVFPQANKSELFNLSKLIVTLSKLGEGEIYDSQVFTSLY